jgi:glycosyltransferase involved in cell wall biosynthesis
MPEVRPAVSVIVPGLNAEATLGRTLDALVEQNLADDFEVIVVDDGSTDGTVALARQHPIGARVLRHDVPKGPGSARNSGAEVARAPVLAFTDADCFPTPDWLTRGLEAIEELDLLQGAVQPDPLAARTPFDRTVVVTDELGLYETANLFVRRELFDEIGGFEDWVVEGGEGMFGWRAPRDGGDARPARRTIGEDVLFGWEARRRGARTGFSPDALVHHAVFAQTPVEAIRYRWAFRHLPALPSRIPEMREHTFYRRWFFYRRGAAFDCALAGILAATVLRRRVPLIAVLPYAELLRRDGAAWRDHGVATVVATRVAADAMSFVALGVGSVGWRSLLL